MQTDCRNSTHSTRSSSSTPTPATGPTCSIPTCSPNTPSSFSTRNDSGDAKVLVVGSCRCNLPALGAGLPGQLSVNERGNCPHRGGSPLLSSGEAPVRVSPPTSLTY